MTLTEMAFTVPSTGIIRPSDGERCCAGRVAIEKIARRATCRMKVIPTTHFTLPHQYASILAATAVRFHWRLLYVPAFDRGRNRGHEQFGRPSRYRHGEWDGDQRRR